MNNILFTLFTRLQNNAALRLVRCLVIFMLLFLVKHDTQTLVDSVNSVGANLFNSILDKFWIPTLMTITGNTEVKLSAVASAKLLCESPSLLDPAAEELWATGYQATFVHLHNVGRMEEDPLQGIQDPKHICVALLANLSSHFRGRFPPVITRYLSQANQATLLQICNWYNLAIAMCNQRRREFKCGSTVESSIDGRFSRQFMVSKFAVGISYTFKDGYHYV
nr:exportin-2 [Tanacetum cinerariifolium]